MSPATETRLYLQYLGVLTVLGMRHPGQDQIDQAFADANRLLEMRGALIRFARDSTGGWSPITVEQARGGP